MYKLITRFSKTPSPIITLTFSRFCTAEKISTEDQPGTDYTNWVLARATGHNHSIAHLKRKMPKDRYSLHRLTNLSFICDIVTHREKYQLTQNEKIVLLAQLNHVIEVMGKNRSTFSMYTNQLLREVMKELENPPDLVCFGTLMNSLSTMRYYESKDWVQIVDDILVQKFDEDYDELFGLIIGLNKYKNFLKSIDDYALLSKDQIIPQIPIIYRNSLEILRQFITQNIYNLKECRLLIEALYAENINEGFFWRSIRDWFNIYTKEQLNKKLFDEFFILKENCVEKVLHDHGIIRPRPILQELSSIVYILSEFDNTSWRFIEFAQDLILYSIENGSALYKNYEKIAAKEEVEFSKENNDGIEINEHIETFHEIEKENIKEMEKKYRTIFINPIELKDNFLIYFLVILARAYKMYEQQKKTGSLSHSDKKEEIYMDPRVKKWLLLRLVKPEMHYTLKELLLIYRSRRFLEDSQINLNDFIADKMKNLRETHASFADIEMFLKIIPTIKYDILNPILQDFLHRNHPREILSLVKLIEKNKLFPYMSEFMLRLPKSVNKHEKYFSFEENCYFFLMILQNSESINAVENKELHLEFDSEMERLKELLKIVTYSRGFKLAVNSYFHQVMEYIDVVEFFEGGQA